MASLSTTHKKILIYTFGLLNLLVIIVMWWSHSGGLVTSGKQSEILIGFGRITGLLGEFFILIELILIGRITWLEQLFGFDQMNKIHRWIGYGILTFFIGHPVLTILGYAERNGVGSITQFLTFIHIGEYLRGLIGFILFFVVILLSYPIIKKKFRYETWYFAHLLMYLAIGLVIGHQTFADIVTIPQEPALHGFTLGGDVSAGLALYYWFVLNYGIFGVALAYRWIKPLYLLYRHRFYIHKVEKETSDVYSIYITGKDMKKYHFQAGQYANLTFFQKGMWFTHPFSYSCAPNGKYLRFSIKSLGDFTSEISKLTIGTYVLIDGPMGLFTENQAMTEKFLLIAGGIGITPLRALIEVLSDRGKDVVLLYATKSATDIAFKAELESMSKKHHFVISQIIEDGTTLYEKGRIDKEKIARLVPDYLERDAYVCGPTPMMKAVVTHLQELGVPKGQIHFEKFSY